MKLPKFLMMLLSAAALLSALSACKKSDPLEKPEGFVAAWNFADGLSSTCGKFTPTACGNVKTVNDGPLSGKSLELDGKSYLSIPYAQTGALNVKSGEVTVVAWVKWAGEGVGFVGGMWNEYKDGGKRQYGLFVSLPTTTAATTFAGTSRKRASRPRRSRTPSTIRRAVRKSRTANGSARRSPTTASTYAPT